VVLSRAAFVLSRATRSAMDEPADLLRAGEDHRAVAGRIGGSRHLTFSIFVTTSSGPDGKFCSKELETVGDTPGNGTANQSHCGCRTEHDPEFFGPEPRVPPERPATPNALKSA
jgi:hypothetical protein